MKTYSAAPDVEDALGVAFKHHEELEDVRVAVLFVFDSEDSSTSVLNHNGYPAQAVTRIIPLRERALGMADALIVVDRSNWVTLGSLPRLALLDHELTHLERAKDEDGVDKYDALGRPKLLMRRHDHQFGWFDDVAQRHGDASPEIRQAKALIAATGQLYFDFSEKKAA